MPSPSPLSRMAPPEGPPGLILEDGQARMEESGPLGNQVLLGFSKYIILLYFINFLKPPQVDFV